MYKHFGVMLDVSRNAIINVETTKKMIDCLQMMGYNCMELYAEDTYRLKDEPQFGYQRGGYTPEELKEIDGYAKSKGIEVIPCVQTLAHFGTLVRMPKFAQMRDAADILLIDDERTYDLIDKIFANAAECFTSRRINVGMDEADLVGLGKYLREHGYVDRFELLNKHLSRVCEIAKKYGFTPHMWSDMYFRLANNGEYYGRDVHFDQEVLDKVPENIELAYWDYYNRDIADYDAMITSHKEFNREIWFAGGAWTWNGFAPLNYYSLSTMRPAMESVRKHGVEHVFITMWGDNGKECSFFSVLPSLYAIRQYAEGNFDEASIKAGFEKLFKIPFDTFMLLDIPNHNQKVLETGAVACPSKVYLYSDPFMGVFDELIEKDPLPFGERSKTLLSAEKSAGEYGYLFRYLGELCHVLECKASLGVRTRNAYKAGDKAGLKKLLKTYGEVEKRLESFYGVFRELWFKENKPFGWEVQDMRLGGLMRRVKHCKARLVDYVKGKISRVEELEEENFAIGPTMQCNGHLELVSRCYL